MSESLNSFLFSTPEMMRIFSPEAQLRAMMRFEWALTRALEKNGIAEPGSAAVLEALLDAAFVDQGALLREAADAGNVAIPFVRQLNAAVKSANERASRTVHLGATSQDVLDTALVLEMREGFALINASLARLDDALVAQTRKHARTILSGRTWLQPGPPTTLGLKLAGVLSALRRSRERMGAAAGRAIHLQFGGAVGTLSALGDAGVAVSAELARTLDLPESDLPWHTQRDAIAEVVEVLAILVGSVAKFARDVALLMQAEVAEASEGTSEGKGGSSTMPHKHNPVGCAAILAIHARMPGLAATMIAAMPQEHERGLGLWQAEWETVPEAFRLSAAAVAYATQIAEELAVDEARMKANIDALLGLPQAEAVSAALAPKMGRAEAHALLRGATQRAAERKQSLAEVLKETPEATAHLSAAEIDRLLDPRAYLGSAQQFIARVLRQGKNH